MTREKCAMIRQVWPESSVFKITYAHKYPYVHKYIYICNLCKIAA